MDMKIENGKRITEEGNELNGMLLHCDGETEGLEQIKKGVQYFIDLGYEGVDIKTNLEGNHMTVTLMPIGEPGSKVNG